MWLCLNDGFLSIVHNEKKPGTLLVRARSRKHLQAFCGKQWKITVTPNRDYRFRAVLPAGIVSQIVAQRVLEIDYGNFKDSVEDDRLHDMYALWWGDHHKYQTGCYTAHHAK